MRLLLLVLEKNSTGIVLLVVCWLGALLVLLAKLLGLANGISSERTIYALLVVGLIFFAIGPLLAKDIDRRR